MQYLELIVKLIDSYMKLFGIGGKIVMWLVFYIIDMNGDDVIEFVKLLIVVKWDLYFCSICGNIIEDDLCVICKDKLCD